MRYFFHVIGERRRSIGKSSSLPASISKIRTDLESGEKNEKFAVGPTRSSPGPTLLMQAETAVRPDIPPTFSIESTMIETMKSIA